jgi:outer membrane protein assembly factor BamB
VEGQDQLVVTSNDGLHGLDPSNGEMLWGPIANEKQYGAHMSTPLWSPADRLLFFSAAYDGGGKVLQLSRPGGKTTKVEELWFSNKMRVHFGNALRIGDHYYGSSGDFGPSFLTAVDAKTGDIRWQDRTFNKANLVQSGNRVILLDEDGVLALVTLSPDRMTVLARAPVATGTAWTAPALVGTTLYVRDRTNIMALDVGSDKAQGSR